MKATDLKALNPEVITGVQLADEQAKVKAYADIIAEEMRRQLDKWGIQNPPSYTSHSTAQFLARQSDQLRETCENKHNIGRLSWTDILLEEVGEAMQEAVNGDIAKLRAELIQVAAVCGSWIASIDRNAPVLNLPDYSPWRQHLQANAEETVDVTTAGGRVGE